MQDTHDTARMLHVICREKRPEPCSSFPGHAMRMMAVIMHATA